MALFASLIGIALVDSLNPSLFIAQFYLITTPRPVTRILSYIAGLLLVNYIGGVLFLAGIQAVIGEFFAGLHPNILLTGQLLVGAALLGFGLWFKARPAESGEAKKPHSLQPIHTFVLGMIVMLQEITTAFPYFVAIERIAAAQMPTVHNFLALAGYNLIFALPLFGFLGLFLAFRDRFTTRIEQISQVVRVWTPRIIKWAAIGFGIILIGSAIL